MKLKAVAIDDEPLALELLQKFCQRTDFIALEKTFSNHNEAQKYLRKFSVDLLFLDIRMPKISGIELYKNIEQENMVIFTTAHTQYAVDGFNLNAVDYLLKPFSFERFLTAVNRANDFYNYQLNKANVDIQHLYVRSEYALHPIPVGCILYIECFGDYLNIHLTDNKKITTRMSLKTVIEKLPKNDFIRVHRSYIVAMKYIKKVQRASLFIGEKPIPVGTNYKDVLSTILKMD